MARFQGGCNALGCKEVISGFAFRPDNEPVEPMDVIRALSPLSNPGWVIEFDSVAEPTHPGPHYIDVVGWRPVRQPITIVKD